MKAQIESFQVELVWNREHLWVRYADPYEDIEAAIKFAQLMESSGDGARVKKTRIIDGDGKVVWAYGKKVDA